MKRLTVLPTIAIALSLAVAPDAVARTAGAFDPATLFGADDLCGTDPASANARPGLSGAMAFMDDPDAPSAALPTTEMGRLHALVALEDVTIRSNGDGVWSEPTSWLPARVPVAGDRVHVREGETITLDGERDAPRRVDRRRGPHRHPRRTARARSRRRAAHAVRPRARRARDQPDTERRDRDGRERARPVGDGSRLPRRRVERRLHDRPLP